MTELQRIAQECAVMLKNHTSLRISELHEAFRIILQFLEQADERRKRMVINQALAENAEVEGGDENV